MRVVVAVGMIVHQQALLVTRKRTGLYFTLPGGKIEAGESPEEALIRELQEELSITLAPGFAQAAGVFGAAAAHEAGHQVEAHVFRTPWPGVMAPAGEIEEVAWLPLAATPYLPIAPLIEERILPLLRGDPAALA